MKIFIGGSKTIGKLPEKEEGLIGELCLNGHEILIGDCYDVDLAVQRFFCWAGL